MGLLRVPVPTAFISTAAIDGFVARVLTYLAVFAVAYAVLNLLVYDRAVLTLSRDHDRLVLAVLTSFRFRVRQIIIDEAPATTTPELVNVRLVPSHRFYQFDRPDQAPVYVRMGRGYSSAIEDFLRPSLG